MSDFYTIALNCARAVAESRRSLEAAETFLHSLKGRDGKVAAGLYFGVEYCELEECERSMRYLNTGDSYDATIVEENGQFTVTSWGDWVEAAEAEKCEADESVRCGWCGHFTPMDMGDRFVVYDWHDVLCESCGNYVDGGHGPNNDRNGYPRKRA